MLDHVEEMFSLPKVKKMYVAKKELYEASSLNTKDREIVSKAIEKIYFVSTFDERFGVPKYITEIVNYSGIEFLWVELRDSSKNKRVADILQQSIPKPVVLVMDYRDEIQINTALKRYSLNEANRVVIEGMEFSHVIDMSCISEQEAAFLESIKLKNLSYVNLYEMYHELYSRVFLSRLIDIIGTYPEVDVDVGEIRELVRRIERKEEAARVLKRRHARSRNLADGMNVHIQLVQTNLEIKSLTDELKGAC